MRTYGRDRGERGGQSIANWGDSGRSTCRLLRVLPNFTSSHCTARQRVPHRHDRRVSPVYHALERGVTPIAYLNAHLPIRPSARATRRVSAGGEVAKIIRSAAPADARVKTSSNDDGRALQARRALTSTRSTAC